MTTVFFRSENGIEYKIEIGKYIVWVFEHGAHGAGYMAQWTANGKLKVPLDWEYWNGGDVELSRDLTRYVDKYIKNMVFA
jgi:hypothetical protein